MAPPAVTAEHGTTAAYQRSCRCVDCRAANAEYARARKTRLAPADCPHGTLNGYSQYRCRCDPCVTAKRLETRDYYVRNQSDFLDRYNHRQTLKKRDRRRVTAEDIRKLFERFDNRCAYCDDRAEHLEIDHVLPLARGGRHAIGNLLPACRKCNRSKHDHLLVEWRNA